jgi:serine protease Do
MLVNGAGQVVGVNTAFLSDHANGGSLGLGFAIPAAEATQTLSRLKSCNPQPAGWIGVSLQPVTPEIAAALGLSHPTGSIVTAVTKDSPAQQAGLQEGDVLERLGDAPEATPVEMLRGIAAADIGSTVHLSYRRQGQIAQASVTVAAWPEQYAAPPSKAQTAAMRANATPHGLGFELTDEHGPSGAARVVVRSIDPAIAAADAGLRQGDVVLRISQTPAVSAETVRTALHNQAEAGRTSVPLLVESGQIRRWIAMPLG